MAVTVETNRLGGLLAEDMGPTRIKLKNCMRHYA